MKRVLICGVNISRVHQAEAAKFEVSSNLPLNHINNNLTKYFLLNQNTCTYTRLTGALIRIADIRINLAKYISEQQTSCEPDPHVG